MSFNRTGVAAGIALAMAASAFAQDIKLNVTGTNIKRTEAETAAPIEVITREDIQASGLQTIAAVVQSITANNNGTISNAFVNGFAAGSSGVSLRGLGANNTLVLLNGRRLAVYGLADDGQRSFVNLNQVPFDAVERIEVLKDGASAIYGSDAVAGVVNVILRDQYKGLTATGTAGTTYKGDGDQFRGAVTAGVGDLTKDRYNAFITVDGQHQQAISTNNRKQYIGTNNLTFMGLPDARPGNPLSGFGSSSLVGNVRPVFASDPNGTPGVYSSLPGCAPGNVDDQGFCRWDVKDYLQIQPKTQNINVLGKAAYQINDTTQAYAELSYFQSKVTTQFTPQAFRTTWYNTSTSSVISSANIYLPVGHPDNPFPSDQVARLYYAGADIGGRNASYQDDTQRYLAGLKGTNYGWDWDAGVMYIRNDGSVDQTGYLNYQNLLNALSGVGGFGYYRVGANANLNNPGVYGYISPTLRFDTVSENTQVDFKASRDLMKLEGGQMAIALGAEFRREELDNPGENEVFLGQIMGLGYSSAHASRNVTAVYGELFAPVLRNLELTAALRYDHYSDYGSNWAPKVGVKYTPIQQLVLRGTYSTGFRAPGPYESGNSATNGFTSVVDPVRCPITGSPADCGSGTVGSIAIGNPQLSAEKSNSWTVGLVWEPAPGLSGTLDYWNIETKDVISGADPQLVVNSPAAFPSAFILRDPTTALAGIPNSGTLLAVASPFLNSFKQATDGIDVSARYRIDAKSWGVFTPAFEWTHIFHFTRDFGDGTKYEYAGTHGPTSLSSSAGIPKDKWNLALAWERGPWNVTGVVRYVGPMDTIEAEELPDCLQPDFGNCTVASFTTLDLSASYKGFKNWEIFGSVINVFNRIAPFDVQAAYGGYNYNYNYAGTGATGTQFNLGVRYTFQ
jgi:iron complex outermembrane receptor protein